MNWNIDFDLFGCLILGILIICFFRKMRFPNIANKVYGYLIISSFVAGIINIVNCIILNDLDSSWIISAYIFTTLYFIAISALTPMLIIYVLTSFSPSYTYSKLSIVLIFIPYMIQFVEIAASFATGYVFTITLEDGLQFGSGMTLINIIDSIYLLAYMIATFMNRHKIPHMVNVSIYIYAISCLAIHGVMYGTDVYLPLDGMINPISFLILFFSIHNPTIMIDESMNIFNKKALTEFLDIKMEDQTPIHIITVSLDNYKIISDTFGVTNSDGVLFNVCRFLKNLAPKKRLYRYSNDCFTIVIPQKGNYQSIVEEISNRFADVWKYNGITCKLTATTSIITAPDFASSTREIYDLIEFTLSEIKTLDKGSIICSDSYLKAKMNRQKRIEVCLSNAIEHGLFDIYFQPIFNLQKQRFTAAESLIRLYDTELGSIPPEEFISVAEKNGSIIKIGTIVLEKVCQFITKYHPERYGFEFISVNLSVVQCMQNGIIPHLEEILEKYRISKKFIHFEITETVATNSMALFSDLLNKMDRRGFHLTLDDYGSGYSTLSYIMHLPFATIKLDKTLIDDACDNIRSKVIVDSTVSMLKKLDVDIVAEGAEVPAQVEMLHSMGCKYIQGFYFSRPLPQEDFAALVTHFGEKK